MSSTKIKMIGKSPRGIREIADDLRWEIKAELVDQICRKVNGADVMVLLFEKLYFRNGSYAGLMVMLTEQGEEKLADIVGFGGGEGLFNISWGANSDFAELAQKILQKHGFSVFV